MGAWSASVNGNDTAQDLLPEYSAAFYKYPVEEALEKLDAYVRANCCDESDPEEWVNYYYSLADFLWKKGILPDRIRDRAVEMIDSRFGMELWEQEGTALLRQREKALAQLRQRLLSPLPPKKKIKPKVHMNPIFQPGDLIALRLQTAGKGIPGPGRKICGDPADPMSRQLVLRLCPGDQGLVGLLPTL